MISSSLLVFCVWTCGLTLVFGRLAAYNLGNYRPATNDEVELMSVGFKLATQGVMGSDLFAGFWGADHHYLFTLPLQHVLEAIDFKLFGAGLAQARWVSLLAGASSVWLVGWLAYRWYGLATAVVGQLLLVAWPSNVTLATDALPLFGVARVARYDVLAVAFAWLAIALLDATLRRPRRSTSLALGVCCGLASLTTFTGVFVLPLVCASCIWMRARHGSIERAQRWDRTLRWDRALGWTLAGSATVLVPWAAYCLVYRADLLGQLAVYGGRWSVLQPGFYVANLLHEPARYRDLLATSTVSTWLLAIGIWPALGYIAWRSRSPGALGDRILVASVVTFGLVLVALDQTKTPLYAIVLVPSVCVAMAALARGSIEWAWTRRGRWRWPCRVTSSMVAVGVLFGVGADGVRAYQQSLARAAQTSQYLGVGLQLEDSLPPGARVLGPERWWWALHDHPYLSLRSTWFQWSATASGGAPRPFADWVVASQAERIVVNDNVRGDILDFPQPLQLQFWAYLERCATRILDLDDPTYLQIEVYAVTRPPPPASRACTPVAESAEDDG